MSAPVLLVSLVLFYCTHDSSCLVIQPVDVKKIDYCKLPCEQYNREGEKVAEFKNSACECYQTETHVEELREWMEFRTTMIDYHNYFRNRLAGGEVRYEGKVFYPKAANMRALSYSMENEYIARCYANKIYDYHDDCRRSSLFEHCGQNMGFREVPYSPLFYYLTGWWKEYTMYNPEWVKNHTNKVVKDTGHFTQMAWALEYHIGCARSWSPKKDKPIFRWTFLCNYGGGFANVEGRPVYLEGEPCSKCPNGTTCNKKYKNLCGEIDPIPTDPPVPIYLKGQKEGTVWNEGWEIEKEKFNIKEESTTITEEVTTPSRGDIIVSSNFLLFNLMSIINFV